MTITDKDKAMNLLDSLLKTRRKKDREGYDSAYELHISPLWDEVDALLSKPDEEQKPEQRTYTHAEVCDLLDTFMKLVDLIDTDPDEAKRRIEAAQARLASRAPVAPSPDMPIEQVDDYLRSEGIDPDEEREHGRTVIERVRHAMDAAKLIEDARAFASELSERGNSTASKWLERAMAHRNGLKWKDDEEDKAEGSYRMSKDYEALWMHLEAGGEALGRMNHPDSSPRFPVIEPTDIRPLHVPFWQALMTSGRQTFTIVCQQRQLEWLAPSPDTAVNDQPQCTRR